MGTRLARPPNPEPQCGCINPTLYPCITLCTPVSHLGTSAVLSGTPTFPLVSNMPTAMRAYAPWLATETMPRAFMVLQMPASSPLRQRRGRGGEGKGGKGRDGEEGEGQ